MGLSIISTRSGSGGADAAEFTHKVKEAKRLITEICEDVERMFDEFGGGISERGGYREAYRDGYYRGYDDVEMRRRRY